MLLGAIAMFVLGGFAVATMSHGTAAPGYRADQQDCSCDKATPVPTATPSPTPVPPTQTPSSVCNGLGTQWYAVADLTTIPAQSCGVFEHDIWNGSQAVSVNVCGGRVASSFFVKDQNYPNQTSAWMGYSSIDVLPGEAARQLQARKDDIRFAGATFTIQVGNCPGFPPPAAATPTTVVVQPTSVPPPVVTPIPPPTASAQPTTVVVQPTSVPPPVVTPVPTSQPPLPSSVTAIYLGMNVWHGVQLSIPLTPAAANETYVAHGDVLGTGGCNVMKWGPGQAPSGLSDATWQLYLLRGGTDQDRQNAVLAKQAIAARETGSCPFAN